MLLAMGSQRAAYALATEQHINKKGHCKNKNDVKQSFSLVAQTVKRLPTMRETRVQSLGREDLL